MITHPQAETARKAPLGLHIAQPDGSVAPWFQEEVRRELEKRFGTEQVHEAGLKVETTLDLDLQQIGQPRAAGRAGCVRATAWLEGQAGECAGRRRDAGGLPASGLGGAGASRRLRSRAGDARAAHADAGADWPGGPRGRRRDPAAGGLAVDRAALRRTRW